MQGMDRPVDLTPTIVMFREPMTQFASFYNYSKKGGGEISTADSFAEFLRSPMTLNPDEKLKYQYASPIDYWTQFYFSCLHWDHPQKYFVELSELQKSPSIAVKVIEQAFPNCQIREVPLPEGYLERGIDRHISKIGVFQPGKNAKKERSAVENIKDSINEDHKRELLIGPIADVLALLNKIRVRP